MNNRNILNIGKCIFGLCFLLGNICLFGYIISKDDSFAIGGYFLLVFGTLISLPAILGLVIYGLINKSQLKICMKSSIIICINVPVAILYALVGINICTV